MPRKSEVEVRLDWIVATSVTGVISGRKIPQNVKRKFYKKTIKPKNVT